jgi:hypothetical protein
MGDQDAQKPGQVAQDMAQQMDPHASVQVQQNPNVNMPFTQESQQMSIAEVLAR